MMIRREFLTRSILGFLALSPTSRLFAENKPLPLWEKNPKKIEKIELSEEQWRERLTGEQFSVLRREATERPHSSILNKEYREGEYLCAGCGLLLFTSGKKYESGTGWPSFYDRVEAHIETKRDYKLLFLRTEYHCARCGGHQGHVFNDGPKPTGKRWCNNGVALRFIPFET